MNKLLLLVFIILAISSTALFYHPGLQQPSTPPISPTIVPSPTYTVVPPTKTAIFIPYWANFENSFPAYDRYIYFGITPTTRGINMNDQGYTNLDQFTKKAGESGKQSLLTLRMLDTDTNMTILHDKTRWDDIIDNTIEIAKQHSFSGIVLDLELSLIPLTKVSTDINAFVKEFSTKTHQANLSLAMTVYGDTFYRARPFDLQTLNQDVDEFLIMAYDMHKANGEPGPNFPLRGKDKYGYDMVSMVADLKQAVNADKLTIIFGMYGYDWAVDEKKRPLKAATAISLKDIQDEILSSCKVENCLVRRDDLSGETEVNYVKPSYRQEDKYYISNPHIVWFEDRESVKQKQDFLKNNGIASSAFWVYGYF